MPIDRPPTVYVCDISGLAQEAWVDHEDTIDEDDPLEDCPTGWSQVLIRTRNMNPDYIRAREVYRQAVTEVKAQFKDDTDQSRVQAAMFALRQQFAPLLATPRFSMTESEIWVHPQYRKEMMDRLDPETADMHEEVLAVTGVDSIVEADRAALVAEAFDDESFESVDNEIEQDDPEPVKAPAKKRSSRKKKTPAQGTAK